MDTDQVAVAGDGSDGCQAAECGNQKYARGLCKYHYHRARREGTLDPSPYWGKWRGKTCSEDGCEEPVSAKGLCVQHYNKARWEAGFGRLSPEDNRNRHLKHRYGITADDYNAMLDAQGGACAICQRFPEDADLPKHWKKFAVDHCHDSGVVRGLLCNHCNIILKHGVTHQRLDRAAEYLRNGGAHNRGNPPDGG